MVHCTKWNIHGITKNSYAGRHSTKRLVHGITAFHQLSILSKVGELMVNYQYYDSYTRQFLKFCLNASYLMVPPVPTRCGVGGVVGQGRHNATFHGRLSCKIEQTFWQPTMYWIKPWFQRWPKGKHTRRDSKDPIFQKKKFHKYMKQIFGNIRITKNIQHILEPKQPSRPPC